MSQHIPNIALDVMGGDDGLPTVIEGAELARVRNPALKLKLYGDASQIGKALEAYPKLAEISDIIPAEHVVHAMDKPSQALRRMGKTSMGLAVNAVKEGKADAAMSAGNTGALMAMAKISLRTLEGIDRPALATLVPTSKGSCVMLDLGANTECNSTNLVQFAAMGSAFAKTILMRNRPSVALLNIGVEDMKGPTILQEAFSQLHNAKLPIDFRGFTEGDQIGVGDIDVIVTDGFSGNIALKSIEGTARLFGKLMKVAFSASWMSKLGFLLAAPSFNSVKNHIDPNNHNGAIFLGLNGLVIKSHGSADSNGIANAIGLTTRLIQDCLLKRISKSLPQFRESPQSINNNNSENGSGNQETVSKQ